MGLTNTEKSRRHQDKIASIDAEMDAALEAVDWERRNAAEEDVEKWIDTYLVGLMMEDAPSPKMRELLH